MTRPVINVAHRGLSSLYPENTLIAFEKAIALNVDMCELDVRYTTDRQIVVMHDATLDRVTNGNGKVADLTAAEIKKFKVTSKREGMPVQRVPLLNEIFAALGTKGAWRIEMKEDGIEKDLVELIARHGLQERVILISFSFDSVARARRIAPEIPAGFITGDYKPEIVRDLVKAGLSLIDIAHPFVTPETVRFCHSRGIGVEAWTVDESKGMEEMIAFGVDGIATNRPHILKRVLGRKQPPKRVRR